MTASELLAIARKGRPNVTYTTNTTRNAIGALLNGEFVLVAGVLMTGEWVVMPDLLVNGKPIPREWLDPNDC